MQIVNVVIIEGGVMQSVESFVITNDRNTSIVREAERVFVDHIMDIAPMISDDEIDSVLAEGSYIEENHPNREVYLIWSDSTKVG